jgi:hypothetical protein
MSGDKVPIDIRQLLLASFVRQTSVPFRFPRHCLQDHDRQPWTIYNTAGVTVFATNVPREKLKKERFSETVIMPNDAHLPRSLCALTAELSQFTGELFDIEIVTLSVTWGLSAGELPSLLGCEGTFRCTPESRPHARFLTDIALFIALETGQAQEPGKCFSRRPVCVAPDISCPRQKIETWRIKKLANGLGADARGEFVHYVKRRLGLVCPTLLVSTVLVCRNCFALYARERMPAPDGTASPLPARTASVRASALADAHRPDTSLGIGGSRRPGSRTSRTSTGGRSTARGGPTSLGRSPRFSSATCLGLPLRRCCSQTRATEKATPKEGGKQNSIMPLTKPYTIPDSRTRARTRS